MSKTALVVDDHPVTHIGCRRLLGEAGYETILEASDYTTAYRTCERTRPDLIVLDVGLPGVGGLQMIRPLLERAPGARILVFSMSGSPAFAATALGAGAFGYLAKNSSPEDFLTAVRHIEAGQIYLERDLAIGVATQSVCRDTNPLAALTAREHQILKLLADGFGYKEIAAHMNLSYKSVANACTGMKRKLSARTFSDLIRIAVSNAVSNTETSAEPRE